MRGGVLPAAMLCAALGFVLSFARRRTVVPSLLVLAAVGLAASRLDVDRRFEDAVFFGCWASVLVAAAVTYLSRSAGRAAAVALSANAGFWAGAVCAAEGTPAGIVKALPLVLLCLPGGWLVATKRSVVLKVMASWLVAVSILAATLSVIPVTPGYEPDHLE